MKIAVHAQALREQRLTGIGYYSLNLLKTLFELDHINSYSLFSNKPLVHELSAEKYVNHLPLPFSYCTFVAQVRSHQCDLVFIPKEVVPFGLKQPALITAYDLYYLKCRGKAASQIPKSAWLHYYLAAQLHLKRASHICAISEDTKKDLIEIAGVVEDKITVTPLGYEEELFYPHNEEEIKKITQKYALNKPYFINTSSVWWERKNLIRLIEAFSLFKQHYGHDCALVITGKRGASYEQMQQLIQQHGLEHEIRLLDYVPRKDLPCLLQGSLALVFPSLHEGFGLPIIEAMATGCPVICSNVSAMPEAAGHAALLINPLEIEEIAEAMKQIVENLVLASTLKKKSLSQAKKFSWNNTAYLTLNAMFKCF